MDELEAVIRAEIATQGPIRFERFMELALYHPELGYYNRPRAAPVTGRRGDFLTSVSVGPLFGRLLTVQIFQMWERLGRPGSFRVVEQGANDARLALDILAAARDAGDTFTAALRYDIVEPGERARTRQEAAVNAAGHQGRVTWASNLAGLDGAELPTIFLSNELVDAFPVHVVRGTADGTWEEQYVDEDEQGILREVYRPIDDPGLITATRELTALPGYITEINLRARTWMREVAENVRRGYVLTLDYGFPASLYYAPFRREGTLSAYRAHHRALPLVDPGHCDITAHVDFTALARAGRASGLEPLGLLNQQRFFLGVATRELAGGATTPHLHLDRQVAAWQTLTHPLHFGERFLVLVQARDAPGDLDGLRFARPETWE